MRPVEVFKEKPTGRLGPSPNPRGKTHDEDPIQEEIVEPAGPEDVSILRPLRGKWQRSPAGSGRKGSVET